MALETRLWSQTEEVKQQPGLSEKHFGARTEKKKDRASLSVLFRKAG